MSDLTTLFALRPVILGACALSLVLLGLLGCAPMPEGRLAVAETQPTARPTASAIPPLDAAAPSKTETATFAMG